MTMHPTEIALNEYADAALPEAERAAVAEHLRSCGECRRMVDDLRRIKEAARTLTPMTPPDGAWDQIRREAARTAGAPAAAGPVRPDAGATRRATPGAYWWMAAAAAVLLAVGGGYLTTHRGQRPQPVQTAATAPAPDAQMVAAEFQQARDHYEKAITGVEQIMNSEKGTLDPQTAASLAKGFPVVDQAIEESQAALKQNPTSVPAQQSLLENFRTKLALLEDTVALINEMRKGDEAGTARIASGLKQKG